MGESGDENTLQTSDGSADGGVSRVEEILPLGTSVHRYVILGPIGQGGMGTIYKAYDPELDRRIAIKILAVKGRNEEHSSGPRGRLLREAQALAQLSHPNVISVYDVGTLGSDVFIAMELVEGQNLRQWLKATSPTLAQKLAAMRAAGEGLAAAHRAGIVHRDFKPENVLVGQDGRVRVIDFGLAKADLKEGSSSTLSGSLPGDGAEKRPSSQTGEAGEALPTTASASGEIQPGVSGERLLHTPMTRVGAVLGTPHYISPEQFLSRPTDSRTDQFSFAATLFEILAGKTAFRGGSLKQLRTHILQGKHCEAPPGTIPTWVLKIIQRGLSIAPNDRYPSMEALLADLNNDPARVRKRRLAALGIVLLVALAGLGVLSTYQRLFEGRGICRGAREKLAGIWDEPTRARVEQGFLGTGVPYAQASFQAVDRAFQGYAAGWTRMVQDSCEATRVRGEQSEELFDLRMGCLAERRAEWSSLVQIFLRPDADTLGRAVKAASELTALGGCADVGALRAKVKLPADPAVRKEIVALQQELSEIRALEMTARFGPASEKASAVDGRAERTGYPPLVAQAAHRLGNLQMSMGKYDDAEESLHRAQAAAEEGADRVTLARAATSLLRLCALKARHREAHWHGRFAGAVLAHVEGQDSLLATWHLSLGELLEGEAEFEQARHHYQEALGIRKRVFGEDHPEIAECLKSLAFLLRRQGRPQEALPLLQRALAIEEKALGPEHPDTAATFTHLAQLITDLGRYDEALGLYRRALEIQTRVFGPAHFMVGNALLNLGSVNFRKGDLAQALTFFKQALAIHEGAMGPAHPMVGTTLDNLGETYLSLGRYEEALTCYRRSLAIQEKALGLTHPDLAWNLYGLGEVFRQRGQLPEATRTFARALSICAKKSCEVEIVPDLQFGLARSRDLPGERSAEAARLAREALAGYRKLKDKAAQIREVERWLER